jgi:hypothetical protein
MNRICDVIRPGLKFQQDDDQSPPASAPPKAVLLRDTDMSPSSDSVLLAIPLSSPLKMSKRRQHRHHQLIKEFAQIFIRILITRVVYLYMANERQQIYFHFVFKYNYAKQKTETTEKLY